MAIDQATLDLTEQANGSSLAKLAYKNLNPKWQLEYAAKLGLGRPEYELVKLGN